MSLGTGYEAAVTVDIQSAAAAQEWIMISLIESKWVYIVVKSWKYLVAKLEMSAYKGVGVADYRAIVIGYRVVISPRRLAAFLVGIGTICYDEKLSTS